MYLNNVVPYITAKMYILLWITTKGIQNEVLKIICLPTVVKNSTVKGHAYHLMSQLIWFNWRASEASETLSGVYKFELVWYVYIYIYVCVWRYVKRNSSARHVYVM